MQVTLLLSTSFIYMLIEKGPQHRIIKSMIKSTLTTFIDHRYQYNVDSDQVASYINYCLGLF